MGCLRVGPADVDHRPPATPPGVVLVMRVAFAMGSASIPFVKRHIEPCNRDRLGDRDRVLRAFIVGAGEQGRLYLNAELTTSKKGVGI